MKKLSVVFAMVIAATLSSCSGDDNNGGSGTPSGGFIKAKIDGANFQAEGQFVIAQYDSGSFQIAGTKADGSILDVHVATFATGLEAGKEYNLSATNDGNDYVGTMYFAKLSGTTSVDNYNSAACDNADGTLKITSVSATQIEGTFHFKGKEVLEDDCSGGVKNVTEGSFRAILTDN